MMFIKENLANFLCSFFGGLANITANSACYFINYQDEEPESIKKFRKFH